MGSAQSSQHLIISYSHCMQSEVKLTLLAIACTLTLILMEVLDLPTVDTIVEIAVEVHCIWLLVPFSSFCLTHATIIMLGEQSCNFGCAIYVRVSLINFCLLYSAYICRKMLFQLPARNFQICLTLCHQNCFTANNCCNNLLAYIRCQKKFYKLNQQPFTYLSNNCLGFETSINKIKFAQLCDIGYLQI